MPKSAKPTIDAALARIDAEVERLRELTSLCGDPVQAAENEALEAIVRERDVELVALHEELDDLKSELAGHEDAVTDLERKIEELEGERADRRDIGSALDDASDTLCNLIMQALGVEKVTEDNTLVYQIYRAVEDVRDASREVDGYMIPACRLEQLKLECKASSFVEQLQQRGTASKGA